eukprot:471753_1
MSKGILAYSATIAFCILNSAVGETIQISDSKFDYPFIIFYINNVQGTVIGALIIPIWKYYRSHFNLSTSIIRKKIKEYNALIWFIYYSILNGIIRAVSNILLYISLQGNVVTVPTSNAVNGMEPVCVLILSVLYLNQKLTFWKVASMTIAVGGILCFVFELSSANHKKEQNTETHDTYYGIILTILWTVGFSIYSITTKKMCIYCLEKDKFIIGSVLFYVFQGIVTAILFCWTLYFPKQIEINSFTMDAFKWITINGLTDFTNSVCESIVIALTSPFYMEIASRIGIPISFVADVFVHDYKFNVYAIVGAILIIISFLMLEIKPHKLYSIVGCCNHSNVNVNKNSKSESEKQSELLINLTKNNNDYGTI